VIGSLRGTVLERAEDATVLLEVAGVGYLVTVTPRTLAELEPGSAAFLHVHHHIREDAQTLYGFLQRDERVTFQVLINTHGVGPAMAMAILATHSPAALVDVVATGDLAALTLVPGVGKKTAERLVLELRERSRLAEATLERGEAEPGASGRDAEAISALVHLGYKRAEAERVLRGIGPEVRLEDAIREALRRFAR